MSRQADSAANKRATEHTIPPTITRAKYGDGATWGEQKEFLEFSLTPGQKSDFKAWWSSHPEEVWALFAQLLLDGYKFSVTWNGKAQTHIVTVSTNDERSPNRPYLLTTRHSEALTAIAGAVYKAAVLANGGSWVEHARRNDTDLE